MESAPTVQTATRKAQPSLRRNPPAPPHTAPSLGRIAIALVTGWDLARVPETLPEELSQFEANLEFLGSGRRHRLPANPRPIARASQHAGVVRPC